MRSKIGVGIVKKFKILFTFEPCEDWSIKDVKDMMEEVLDPIYHLGDCSVSEVDVKEENLKEN